MTNHKRYIELLSPARDYEAAIAAIDCGADALYIGASNFEHAVALPTPQTT